VEQWVCPAALWLGSDSSSSLEERITAARIAVFAAVQTLPAKDAEDVLNGTMEMLACRRSKPGSRPKVAAG
jgi:hypothetical protein